jgi:hypothetical protein
MDIERKIERILVDRRQTIGTVAKVVGIAGMTFGLRGIADNVLSDPRLVEQKPVNPATSNKPQENSSGEGYIKPKPLANAMYVIDGVTAASGYVAYAAGKHLTRRNFITAKR